MKTDITDATYADMLAQYPEEYAQYASTIRIEVKDGKEYFPCREDPFAEKPRTKLEIVVLLFQLREWVNIKAHYDIKRKQPKEVSNDKRPA